jgi:putative ABC transport system ATP-binding protein
MLNPANPLVICDNLVKIFKIADLEVVALQGLELVVERGEIVGVVGPSGSGKTTLLNILGGLDWPSAGRVTVGGQDLTQLADKSLNRYQRETVGFVWQQSSRNLIPYLTAQENIEFPMTVAWRNRREKRDWATELLHAVGLYDRRRHRPAQMSGGEQQRIAIAVALANRPVLLLGDEPTGEVDSDTAQAIMDTFRHLSETLELTTIIVTHDSRITSQVDRVVAIRDGKTSTETIRNASQLEQAMLGERTVETTEPEEVTYHEYVLLDSAGRLQVPREHLERFGISSRVLLEVEEDGIMIRPIEYAEARGGHAASRLEDEIADLFADEGHPEEKAGQTLLGRLRRRR